MNITKFIKSHKELNELPFMVVFRTISILQSMGMLKLSEVKPDAVDAVQR